MNALGKLADRRRFGMKLSLGSMQELCRRLGDPQLAVKAVHIAGTNGKGAVAAMLAEALGGNRYTSPHLVSLNERFFIGGKPADDGVLAAAAEETLAAAGEETTFFEALTAAAFLVYSKFPETYTVLETGLGGRFDATNVCRPRLCVITRVGLDHCDCLGSRIEEVAAEKAGIVKPSVPVVLGRNEPSVVETVRGRAREAGAEFVYAPDIADESAIPCGFPLKGAFNRENAVTALAALKTLSRLDGREYGAGAFSRVVWPGRFQEIGRYIVDGAHNPPAAKALADTLGDEKVDLVAGFCGDKDIDGVLTALSGNVRRAWAVPTVNPRSLPAAEVARKMRRLGIEVAACSSLADALAAAEAARDGDVPRTLVCGSLFLAGEAVVKLGAYPWGNPARFDPSELLRPQSV